jgi:hypothetical protein
MIINILDDQEIKDIILSFDNSSTKQDESSQEFYTTSAGVYNLQESLYVVSKLNKIVQKYYPGAKFSNAYVRQYNDGSILGIHTDRPGLDITLSVCLENNANIEWPLNVSNIIWDGIWNSTKDNLPFKADAVATNINVGNGLLCEGVKYPHWRDKLNCGPDERIMYVFYHWTIPNNIKE